MKEFGLVKFAQTLGLTKKYINYAKILSAAGVSVDLKPKALVLTHGGEILSSAGIKLGVVHLIQNGDAGKASKGIVAVTMMKAILDATEKLTALLGNPIQATVDGETVDSINEVPEEAEDYEKTAIAEEPKLAIQLAIKITVLTVYKSDGLVAAVKKLMKLSSVGKQEAVTLINQWVKEDPEALWGEAPELFKEETMKVYSENNGNKIAAIKFLREQGKLSLKFAKDLVETWIAEKHPTQPVVEEDFMSADTVEEMPPIQGTIGDPISVGPTVISSGDKVKLIDATKVGQAVASTDASSTYHVIAISNGVKVAARVMTNGSISIRAEGTETANYSDALNEAGLSKSHSGHWSVHLKVDGESMIRKTVGAVLFSMGIDFDSALTDPALLIGKGA